MPCFLVFKLGEMCMDFLLSHRITDDLFSMLKEEIEYKRSWSFIWTHQALCCGH